MPRLTDASRDARREEIADSVIRVMRRVGFARLSMAEVFSESGLSAGSVYSHFSGKDDLAVFVLRRAQGALLDGLLDEFPSHADSADPRTPAALTRWLIERLRTTGATFPAMVQSYAESAPDSPLRAAALESVAEIRDVLTRCLQPWAASMGRSVGAAPSAPVDLAPIIEGVLIACRGYVSRSAVSGDIDVDSYLAALRLAVANPDDVR